MNKQLRSIKVLIPSQKAELSSCLSPLLGQFGVKVKIFCDEFNKKTQNIKSNLLLKTKINILVNRSFNFNFKLPPIYFYINIKKINNIIFLKDIYIIALLKYKENNFNNINNLKSIYKNILNMLKSTNININYEKN